MSDPGATRPRQVTMAAVLVMVGSVLLVLSVFDQIAALSSLETRESVERFLSEPPGDGLGLGVEGVLELLRVTSMVAAACATAAAVLGFYLLRRSTSARTALSVLALPLLVTGTFAGGLLASVVAVAVVLLWLQPSRDWFAGIDRPQPAQRPQQPQQREAAVERRAEEPVPGGPAAAAPPTGVAPSSEARPYAGFGEAPAWPGADQAGWQAGTPSGPAAPRPPAVVWACVLTWTFAGLVGVLMLFSAVVIVLSPDLVLDELRRQEPTLADEVSQDLLVGTTVAMTAVLVLWCTAAAVLAWLVLRGTGWARVTLLVSAAVAALCCLLGLLVGSFPLIVPLVGCAVTTALLARPEVRDWFARQRAGRG